jgi:hypothetical protein
MVDMSLEWTKLVLTAIGGAIALLVGGVQYVTTSSPSVRQPFLSKQMDLRLAAAEHAARLIWAVAPLVAACFVYSSNAHAEDKISCSNPDSQAMFSSIRDHFIQTHGASEAQPVTTFLKSRGAPILFHQPATSDNKPIRVRIFETNGAELNSFQSKDEVPVLSVEPAPDKLVTGYRPTDSIYIWFEIPERTFPLWNYRSFVVVGCLDNQVTSWALIRAR